MSQDEHLTGFEDDPKPLGCAGPMIGALAGSVGGLIAGGVIGALLAAAEMLGGGLRFAELLTGIIAGLGIGAASGLLIGTFVGLSTGWIGGFRVRLEPDEVPDLRGLGSRLGQAVGVIVTLLYWWGTGAGWLSGTAPEGSPPSFLRLFLIFGTHFFIGAFGGALGGRMAGKVFSDELRSRLERERS